MKTFVRSLVAVGLVSPFLLPLVFLRVPPCCTQKASNRRMAPSTLKTFVSAQEDFRNQDRDGDGKRAFWRADVAGLYRLRPQGSDERIKLIELSAAAADLAPAEGPGLVIGDLDFPGGPKSGYWFAALFFEDETIGKLDPDRFAFCALPDSPAAGDLEFAITQVGVVWERPAKKPRHLPLAFPLDPRTAGWRIRP